MFAYEGCHDTVASGLDTVECMVKLLYSLQDAVEYVVKLPTV